MRPVVIGLVALSLLVAGWAFAAPAGDRILPVDQYKSEKGRQLAVTYAGALREFETYLYHCLPWVEVQKQSIGFFKPKQATQDDRYLSVRVFVEQDPSPQFAALSADQRASSMFSRYVGPLLRRMNRDQAMLADTTIDGYTVILEWLKPGPRGENERPVDEVIAVFVDKPTAIAYLTGSGKLHDLVGRARVLGFDGETPLGQLRLKAWEDNFVSTYKVKNYELAPGISCQ
jgi:hypothetical protein